MVEAATGYSFSHPSDRTKTHYGGLILPPKRSNQDPLQRTHSPAQAVKPRPTTVDSFSRLSDRTKTHYNGLILPPKQSNQDPLRRTHSLAQAVEPRPTTTNSFSRPSGRTMTHYGGISHGGLILPPKQSRQDPL
ncbi:hypothetical protein BHM03_00027326 [Ensete ventricosum]|nr:hypothetical protein BHM03_00027326 [Ensete ventricosum]